MGITIKKTFTAIALLALSCVHPAMAADNSVYISQAGNSTTVIMTQDGAGNVIRGIQNVGGSNTTPALITGNANTVTTDQIGTGNTLDLGLQTSIQNGSSGGNQFSYHVYGNNSRAVIDSNNSGVNTSASNTVSVTQTGDFSYANVNVLGALNTITATTTGGNNNRLISTVNGNNNNQTINVSGGGYNNVTVYQGMGGSAIPQSLQDMPLPENVNNHGTVTLTVTGASNTVNISQAGSINTTVANINGSGNTANIVQSGIAGNTTVNLASTGNGNTFNITSLAH